MQNRALSPKEVADYLSISTQMVYNLIKANELAAFKVGTSVRILANDLNQYIERQKTLYRAEERVYQNPEPECFSVQGLVAHLASFTLNNISVSFPRGQTLAVLGPSGSGKTLLLRALTGLTPLDAGAVFNGPDRIDALTAGARRIGFVFQDYALYPMLDSVHNIAFPHLVRHVDKTEIDRKVEAVLTSIKFPERYRNIKPNHLPEGIKQLVALGHAQSNALDTYIMDEPLSSLDVAIKQDMRHFLKTLVADHGKTTIYSFNDPTDALVLADWVLVLDQGKTVQFGKTLDVYNNPNSLVAMELLSLYGVNTSLLEVKNGLTIPWGLAAPSTATTMLTCAFRPDEVLVEKGGLIRVETSDRRHSDGIHDYVSCTPLDGPEGQDIRFHLQVPSGTPDIFAFTPKNPKFFEANQ